MEAAATDAAGNTATLTRTTILDTVPPALTVTDPEDGLFSLQEVIAVMGSTKVGGQPDSQRQRWSRPAGPSALGCCYSRG